MIIACGRNVFTDEFVQERELLYFTFPIFEIKINKKSRDIKLFNVH